LHAAGRICRPSQLEHLGSGFSTGGFINQPTNQPAIKQTNPGTPEEMVCPGGELAFVRRMAAESSELRGRIHWYTSMVGKKVCPAAPSPQSSGRKLSADCLQAWLTD
jgi:23S rRNA A1618 N6-methylase RlmF